MIVIDVGLSIIKRINKANPTAYFYRQVGNTIEIYTITNNILLRYKYLLTNSEQDNFFMEQNFPNALKIEKISNFNEEPWRELIIEIYKLLSEINDKIKNVNE